METIIQEFYAAFKKGDAEKMVSYYHKDIVFTDPAFGTLKGERAKNMWRMLCQNSSDIQLDVSGITADNNKGKAKWEAQYVFSKTGKKVHNVITANFLFKEDKIIQHIDDFNLHTWAKQAIGFKGALLGGTGFFKKKLNAQTNRLLDKFEQRKING